VQRQIRNYMKIIKEEFKGLERAEALAYIEVL
jgi:hypothetical protein